MRAVGNIREQGHAHIAEHGGQAEIPRPFRRQTELEPGQKSKNGGARAVGGPVFPVKVAHHDAEQGIVIQAQNSGSLVKQGAGPLQRRLPRRVEFPQHVAAKGAQGVENP